MREYEKYYQSEEFKEILQRYERVQQEQRNCYFDVSDLVDVSDYYLNNNDMDSALKAADMGLAMHPQDEDLLLSRANALLFLRQYEEVESLISHMHETSRFDLLFLKAQIMCGQANPVGAHTLFQEWIKEQENLFSQCSDENPTASGTVDKEEEEDGYEDVYSEEELRDAYLHVAMSFDQLCDDADETCVSGYVELWLKEYIKRFPQMGQYDADLDIAHLAQDWDFAEEQETLYKRLLDSNPYLKGGWTCLAEAQEICGHYAEALESADFALAIDPQDDRAVKVKGLAFFGLENFREAKPYFLHLRNREQYDCTPQLAYCFLVEDDKEHAVKFLQECIDWIEAGKAEGYTPEEIAQFYDIIADVYRMSDEYETAMKNVDKAISLDSEEMGYVLLKGEVFLCMSKEKEAFNTFMSILDKTKELPKDLFRIGVVYFLYDYFSMARCFLDVALEMHKSDADFPELTDTYAYLAITNWSLGDTEKAIKCLKEATKRSPQVVKKVFDRRLPDSLADADVFDYIKKNLILKKRIQ